MNGELEGMYRRMRQLLRGRRPDRLPWGDFTWAEYRPDKYHLGHCEVVPEAGEVAESADGTKHFTRDGGVWDVGDPDRFKTHNDVLSLHPQQIEVEEVTPAMLEEMSRLFGQAAEQAYPVPMHYGTLMTRATIEFGWEPFLTAAALQPEKLANILDRFAMASLAVVRGWTNIDDCRLICIHDDIAGTKGLFTRPQWCREYLFDWYQRIFDTIHDAGKKVLYMTDGNYMAVLDDILKTDPDGLYIQSNCIDAQDLMRRAGKDKIYLLKTHSQKMDFGTPEDIRGELQKLAQLHKKYPKLMIYPGGHNPPERNAVAFREYYQQFLVYD